MQLRQAATLIASTVFFLPTNVNVNASLLRGIDGKLKNEDTIEITEDVSGTFFIVSLTLRLILILIQFIYSRPKPSAIILLYLYCLAHRLM